MKSDYTFRGKMCLLSAMLLASTLPVNAKSLTIETETEGTLAEKSPKQTNGKLRN